MIDTFGKVLLSTLNFRNLRAAKQGTITIGKEPHVGIEIATM